MKIQRPEALPVVARDLVILRRGLDYYKGTIFLLLRDFGVQCKRRGLDSFAVLKYLEKRPATLPN